MAQVVLVDDEKSIRVTLGTLLEKEGHDVWTAGNGEEARELFAASRFDVLVTDVVMPRINGLDLLSEIRELDPCVEVVLITGAPSLDTTIRALQGGAFDYLPKPVTGRAICTVVERAAQAKKLKDENSRLQEVYTYKLEETVQERTCALQESERKYRASIEHAPFAIFILNRKGQFMEANRAAVALTGFSEAELRSMTIFDLSAPDAEAALADFKALLREGRVSSERPILRKDGTEILISVDVNRIQDDRFIGFCSDITERRRSEEERQRLLTAFQQTAESIMVTDAKGSIQFVNPAFEATTGFCSQEVIERNPRFLKSGKHDASFYEALWETIEAGGVWSGRFVNRRKDGREYTAEATISPVRSAAGKIVSHVGVLRDISAQLDVEAQLVQAQKMESVGRLAGGIAHDFNNLLTVIHGNCSLLSGRFDQSDPLKRHLEEITNAVHKAAGLTRKLLAFSRRQILQPEILNLNAVVEDITRMLGRLIGEDIELMTRYGPELGNVKADPVQIEQAILNLVINARDAMPSGGELIIETANLGPDGETAAPHSDAAPGSYVMLAISDTGCGMDEETRRQAFEPFFTTKEGDKGTGLGLSIVYGIVKQSGGHIDLISQPEKGAAFKMLFPRVEAALEPAPRPKPALGAVTGSETILIVEDHDSTRELEAEILERLGYKVLKAGSGSEALSLSKLAASVDLLLSDVVMPGGSGLQVAEAFGRVNPKMKVIYASGHADDILASHDLLEKGEAFLQKPFGPEDLARKVREVLNG